MAGERNDLEGDMCATVFELEFGDGFREKNDDSERGLVRE